MQWHESRRFKGQVAQVQDTLNLDGGGSVFLGLSSTSIRVGDKVVVTPNFRDANKEDFLFNYVWNIDGNWEEGQWGSTVKELGHPVADGSCTFAPESPGRYCIIVDIEDQQGNLLGNVERWLIVAGQNSFMRPPVPPADAPTAVLADDVSMIFNIASEQFNSLKEYFIAAAKHELTFKEFRALDHISFEVKRGEAFGLVGTNGSGKSTMLKIIAGVLEPSAGKISVSGTIAPLIELGAGFDMELTAKENIYLNGALLGYRKDFIDEHFQDIVDFAELDGFMDMPLKNYSSGMVARIAFAIATVTEPDILIVDETLSVGDFLFQQKCERRIKELVESDNVTVLLVSHDISLVERICDRVCWIEKGHMRMIGETDEVCEAYRSLQR